MKAFVYDSGKKGLSLADLPKPQAGDDDVLIRVSACGVCRTDLHIIDGELPSPKKTLVPGHQIVGIVEAVGKNVGTIAAGDRVGVPWLGYTCGQCAFCLNEQENLCDHARFTGYQIDGGFAEYTVCHHRFCFNLPEEFSDAQAAPLLCAGMIGYRALRMAGNARVLGFYGFGSAAHILIQIARFQAREVLVFTRPGDVQAQEFALQLGASWAGDADKLPPRLLEAAIIFAPVGNLVPAALRATRKGGTVVCAGIHMSDIPSFPYSILWEERSIRSVANLTRKDGEEFLALAPRVPVKTIVQAYSFPQLKKALDDLRSGRLQGSAVITITE